MFDFIQAIAAKTVGVFASVIIAVGIVKMPPPIRPTAPLENRVTQATQTIIPVTTVSSTETVTPAVVEQKSGTPSTETTRTNELNKIKQEAESAKKAQLRAEENAQREKITQQSAEAIKKAQLKAEEETKKAEMIRQEAEAYAAAVRAQEQATRDAQIAAQAKQAEEIRLQEQLHMQQEAEIKRVVQEEMEKKTMVLQQEITQKEALLNQVENEKSKIQRPYTWDEARNKFPRVYQQYKFLTFSKNLADSIIVELDNRVVEFHGTEGTISDLTPDTEYTYRVIIKEDGREDSIFEQTIHTLSLKGATNCTPSNYPLDWGLGLIDGQGWFCVTIPRDYAAKTLNFEIVNQTNNFDFRISNFMFYPESGPRSYIELHPLSETLLLKPKENFSFSVSGQGLYVEGSGNGVIRTSKSAFQATWESKNTIEKPGPYSVLMRITSVVLVNKETGEETTIKIQ